MPKEITEPVRNYVEVWQSSADEKFYWHLKAPNGEVIANGEGYVRQEGAVERCKNLFPEAEIKMLGRQRKKGKATEHDLMGGEMPTIESGDIIES